MKNLKFIAEMAVYIGAYFLLVDLLSPLLVGTGHPWMWWFVLAIYACSLPLYGLWSAKRLTKKPYWVAAAGGAIFLGLTLFLIDPNLSPWLEAKGIGWLWLVSAAAGIGWMVLQDPRLKREEKREKQSREPSK